MASRQDYASRSHEPTASEVAAWRLFARGAADLALGKSKDWRALMTTARCAGRYRVFGHNTEGNVCIRLIQISIDAASAADHTPFCDELARLADEVLQRCAAADEIRKAVRNG